MTSLNFFVAGEPKPQGSMRAFVVRGKPVITNSNSKMNEWRQRVATEAQWQAEHKDWKFASEGAVSISLDFALPRPKSLGKKECAMTKRPDADKLARAILDALTGILFADDSQVTELNVRKNYCGVEGTPGVYVKVVVDGGE